MKSFEDEAGGTWDAAVGKESYGTFVLLFARRGDPDVRKASLPGDIRHQAEAALGRMSSADLRVALESSVPWSEPLHARRD